MRARIIGTGGYVPSQVLTNAEIAGRLGISEDWIVERTGIHARRVAAPDETTSQMSLKAAKAALENAGIPATDLDMVIVATITPDSPTPSTAARLLEPLGATNAFGFDISAACSGALTGITIAEQFIRTGAARTALVIGAEVLSRCINWMDRDTSVLFGDGAGAVILQASPDDDGPGILSRHMHTDGTLVPILGIPAPGSAVSARDPRMVAEKLDTIHMQGREVFKSAVRTLTISANELVQEAGITMDHVEHVMGHQANIRIIQAVMDRIGLPVERCHVNLDRYGNTSAASIPLLLDEANRRGDFKPGDHLLFMAAGAGLVWGGFLLRW